MRNFHSSVIRAELIIIFVEKLSCLESANCAIVTEQLDSDVESVRCGKTNNVRRRMHFALYYSTFFSPPPVPLHSKRMEENFIIK